MTATLQPATDLELTSHFRFAQMLSSSHALSEQVSGCICQCINFLDDHTAVTAIGKLANLINLADEQREQLHDTVVSIGHIGFLLPPEADGTMLSEIAGAAKLAISSCAPSVIFARELGLLAGSDPVETLIFRMEGVSKHGKPVNIEVFVAKEDPTLVSRWIADGIGTHVAFRVKSQDSVRALHKMFEESGYSVPPFMQGQPMENRGKGSLVIYYDLPINPEGGRFRVEFYHEP